MCFDGWNVSSVVVCRGQITADRLRVDRARASARTRTQPQNT